MTCPAARRTAGHAAPSRVDRAGRRRPGAAALHVHPGLQARTRAGSHRSCRPPRRVSRVRPDRRRRRSAPARTHGAVRVSAIATARTVVLGAPGPHRHDAGPMDGPEDASGKDRGGHTGPPGSAAVPAHRLPGGHCTAAAPGAPAPPRPRRERPDRGGRGARRAPRRSGTSNSCTAFSAADRPRRAPARPAATSTQAPPPGVPPCPWTPTRPCARSCAPRPSAPSLPPFPPPGPRPASPVPARRLRSPRDVAPLTSRSEDRCRGRRTGCGHSRAARAPRVARARPAGAAGLSDGVRSGHVRTVAMSGSPTVVADHMCRSGRRS